jgi:hypothetical protein
MVDQSSLSLTSEKSPDGMNETSPDQSTWVPVVVVADDLEEAFEGGLATVP